MIWLLSAAACSITLPGGSYAGLTCGPNDACGAGYGCIQGQCVLAGPSSTAAASSVGTTGTTASTIGATGTSSSGVVAGTTTSGATTSTSGSTTGGTDAGPSCSILDTSYAAGVLNPNDACLSCQPAVATNQWSNVATGISCDGGVCSGGTCVACVEGLPCIPASNPCHVGELSCSTGVGVCVDTGKNVTNGMANCDAGEVCDQGSCQICVSGTACIPADPCHDGLTSCATGAQTCVDQESNASPGTSCGDAGYYCADGGCVLGCFIAGDVVATGALDSANNCLICWAASPLGWSDVDAGISCGSGKVCTGFGSCTSCAQGTACVPSDNACDQGLEDCSQGEPDCIDQLAPAPNGTLCSSGVCYDGGCDDGCFIDGGLHDPGAGNPSDACQLCRPLLDPTAWTNQADGTSCGSNLVCLDGGCDICDAGLSCPEPNQCQHGLTECYTGMPTCEAMDYPDGTACSLDGGTSDVCSNGNCVVCSEGGACSLPNPCEIGAFVCSPSVGCADAGLLSDGTSCGGGVCAGGVCQYDECYIDGGFYPGFTTNPSNVCQECRPGMSPTSWSPVGDGQVCGMGIGCGPPTCCSGTCVSVGTDDDNCGSCGNTCVPPNATCTCGSCQ